MFYFPLLGEMYELVINIYIGGGPRPQKAPKSPFFKGPFGVLGGKKGTFGALIFFAFFHLTG